MGSVSLLEWFQSHRLWKMPHASPDAFQLPFCSSSAKQKLLHSVRLAQLLAARVVTALATQHEIAFHEQTQHENSLQRPSHQAATQNELIRQGLG